MSSSPFPYPPGPVGVPASITAVSPSFKKQVGNVMGTIILFFVIYLLMLALSLVLVVACVYGGIAVVSNISSLWGILAGLGLIGLAVMIFVFLIKFLFAVSKFDESGSIEVKEEDQPVLFAFVRQVAADTQAPFPKKILISADVNAAVFYNSSFWSMFFPVRKNLLIGLGMVNSVNLSEFKAIIAHEFGHFSQRSMKLGSFVYNVNKIIYNMLYENTSYSGALQGWASIHGIFAIFASITAHIAQGIQWVLRQVYTLINKTYMGLSREMEFHADAVAASVSGSESLITALRRVELGQLSYQTTIEKCNELLREKKYSQDIFQNQRVVLKQMAAEFKLAELNELPVVSDEFLKQSNSSRLNVKNQWASHPSLQDRESHLRGLAVQAELSAESAWVLFRHPEVLQANLTEKIYRDVKKEAGLQPVSNEDFQTWFQQVTLQQSLPAAYNGFYDGRLFHLPSQEEETELLSASDVVPAFDKIFSFRNAGLNKQILTAQHDLQLLKAIAGNEYPANTFDFEGQKYTKENASELAAKVEAEIREWTEQLRQADLGSVRYFLSVATEEDKLRSLYREYFNLRRQADSYLAQINGILELLSPVFSGQTLQIEDIQRMIARLKQEHEPSFKKSLQYWMDLGVLDHDSTEKESAAMYLQSDFVYFNENSFFETELTQLDAVCRNSWRAVYEFLFRKFKYITELQLELREGQNKVA